MGKNVRARGKRSNQRWNVRVGCDYIFGEASADELGDALAEALEQYEFADTERRAIEEEQRS